MGGAMCARRAFIACSLGLLLLVGLLLLLTEGQQPALAAPASAPATDVYTTYLPLVLRNLTLELHPNDTFYNQEWGLHVVEAPRAWYLSCGCPSALIAILDSGVDLAHPDLASKVRTDIDYDFVNGDAVADDDYGHGTHVAGIAGAATNNTTGVAGLGWEATLLPLKVLDANGSGSSDKLATAIRYAADNGAAVINMSLGGLTSCLSTVQQAVDYAYNRGVVLVAAAGNHGTQPNGEMFPANCNHVLGVAATEPDDRIASYSNYGNHVSVAAPGSEIYNTGWPGDSQADCRSGYCYKWGTSMATPHVAGLAALVRAHYPSYTPGQVASAILDNAEDLGASGWDPYYGCGRINAHRALSTGAHSSAPLCLGTQPWSETTTRSGEAPAAAAFAPGEVIVSFQPGAKVGATALRLDAAAEFLPTLGVWRLHVRPGQEEAALAQLQADPAVIYAELNYLVSAW